MENLVNLDVNSVLNWLDVNTQSDTNWTKYINKIENVSLKWNNLNITVITKRAFGDYVRGFCFFILRYVAILLIPLYLISVFWLNFADSFGNLKDNLDSIKENVASAVDLSNLKSPLFNQTKIINDYIWAMDDLLEKQI